MPMVRIRKVGMGMAHWLVNMAMQVRLAAGRQIDALWMLMRVMFVMNVLMLMFEGKVLVLVIMRFGEVQPDAEAHQQPGKQQPDRQRLA